MASQKNRIMIAAPKSGSGKTLITCGLLNLFNGKQLDVVAYKCGPDYIDPMFHKRVLGVTGGNLDSFFSDRETLRDIIAKNQGNYAVIEGVMGIYDGLGGLDISGSAYDIAMATDTPILLVVDARGAGRSVISVIKGIILDDENDLIKGVILNRTSVDFYNRIKPLLEEELNKLGKDVKVLGCLPVCKDVHIESRHLGLKMPEEISDIKNQIDIVSKKLEETCDINALIDIMKMAPALETTENTDIYKQSVIADESYGLKVAVARDEAFCFYYRENLEALKSLGAQLIEFSPIHDECIPEGVDGILLGGGYPENYLVELSDNESMRNSVREAIEAGVPTLAECGGFMYLHDEIIDDEHNSYSMAGIIKGKCVNTKKLVRFGYIEIKNSTTLNKMKGHEFHYFDSTNNGKDAIIEKPGSDRSWEGMHITSTLVAGFPHLYYPSNMDFLKDFVQKMYRKNGR